MSGDDVWPCADPHLQLRILLRVMSQGVCQALDVLDIAALCLTSHTDKRLRALGAHQAEGIKKEEEGGGWRNEERRISQKNCKDNTWRRGSRDEAVCCVACA